MAKYPFVWLGSKRAQKNGVTEKGWRLDLAARAGLPVPNGGILLADLYLLAEQNGIVNADGPNLQLVSPADLADLLFTTIRFPRLEKPCAFRALTDSREEHIHPRLSINLASDEAVANSLLYLWSAAKSDPNDGRFQVMIQEMVAVQNEGSLCCRPDEEHDLMETAGATGTLPRLTRWGRSQPDLPPFARRLQKLMRGLRRSFGDEAWTVTWADDGRVCWLLQIEQNG